MEHLYRRYYCVQHEGFWILAVPETVPNIQGDLGWSSFKVREVCARHSTKDIHALAETNWALRYLVYQERGARWMQQLQRLRGCYSFDPIWLEAVSGNQMCSTALREGIPVAETGKRTA